MVGEINCLLGGYESVIHRNVHNESTFQSYENGTLNEFFSIISDDAQCEGNMINFNLLFYKRNKCIFGNYEELTKTNPEYFI